MKKKSMAIQDAIEAHIVETSQDAISRWYNKKEIMIFHKAVKDQDSDTLKTLCRCNPKIDVPCPACKLLLYRSMQDIYKTIC